LSGRNRTTAWLGLGGNLGDPEASMAKALRAIDADDDTHVVAVSSLYRTPPWGKTDQPDFLNAVAEIETARSPRDLLALCLDAEKALKRVRRERWGPRLIDIDILLYGDTAVHEPGLDVPHPRIAERAFVLVPLAEIAPGLHVAGATVADLLTRIGASGIRKTTAGGNWWRD
jgi:2-amino-4-hydroxy-6-hydroxymethyldihydropteridine diphosphokinase